MSFKFQQKSDAVEHDGMYVFVHTHAQEYLFFIIHCSERAINWWKSGDTYTFLHTRKYLHIHIHIQLCICSNTYAYSAYIDVSESAVNVWKRGDTAGSSRVNTADSDITSPTGENIHTYEYKCMYEYMYTWIYIYNYKHIYTYVCLYIYIWIHRHEYIYIRVQYLHPQVVDTEPAF